MKNKIKIIIGCIVILVIIIAIILGIKHISVSADKISQEYEEDKNLLQTNYDSFNNYISEYNQTRNDLAIRLQSAMYYEEFPSVSASLESFYLSYDELINKIMTSVENLDKACKRDYMEEEYNKMCSSYQLTYEKMINVYIEDINTYNELINNYNEWAKEEKYSTFTSQYITEYIDYNNDSIYEGKVES